MSELKVYLVRKSSENRLNLKKRMGPKNSCVEMSERQRFPTEISDISAQEFLGPGRSCLFLFKIDLLLELVSHDSIHVTLITSCSVSLYLDILKKRCK